jgi:hypothetical protein
MLQINKGEKKRFDIVGQSIKAISFDSYMIANAVNKAPSGAKLSSVDVTAILHQGGRETTLFSGSLLPLHMESNFTNNSFGTSYSYTDLVLKTASVKGERIYAASVNLGGVINLSGSDKISVEVRTHSDVFSPGDSDEGASYMNVSAVEGIGLQYVTPTIKTVTIGSGEGNFRHTIGDNCTGLTLVHTGGDSTTTPIYKSVRIYSDRYDLNDDYYNLVANRTRQMPGLSQDRGNTFCILAQEVDKARIELDLESDNVEASENYVVYRQYETGRKLVSRASAKKQKHTRKAIAKVQKRA